MFADTANNEKEFQGFNFEHNADIGQNYRLWRGTYQEFLNVGVLKASRGE
jgi:hypothetical protein